jgi:hypothetical protein
MTYGPFQPNIDPAERVARLRALQAFVWASAATIPR